MKLLRLAIGLVLTFVLSGCASGWNNSKREFLRNNPKIADRALEVYEVSIDHWVDFETKHGLGRLIGAGVRWRENSVQINDSNRQQGVRRVMGSLIEEASRRYINALIGMHETRSKMNADDKLIYCLDESGLHGRLFIVHRGHIREEVHVTCPWEKLESEGVWKKTLSARKVRE